MNNFIAMLRRFPGIKNKIFVFIKWFIFPFRKMEEYTGNKREIVDIGCGEGLLSIYLSLKNKQRKVYGVDIDRKRIELAKKAGQGLSNLRFITVNALKWKKKVDVIIVSDVFHHFSRGDQEKFLRKAGDLLYKGGCLMIKEINKDDPIRGKLSRVWDFLLYPHDEINYWSKTDMVAKLREYGFSVKVEREAVLFPGSTFLYICIKK